MPVIELELSDRVYKRWRKFLGSEPAGRLKEAGLLGDWVALGFMANVERFLKEGGPPSDPEDEELKRKEQEAAQARRSLSKPQKRVLPMFNENDQITMPEISRVLGVSLKQAQPLVQQWLDEGFLAPASQREGQATFTLGKQWIQFNLVANRPSLNVPRVPHLMSPLEDLGKGK